jgi:hypothetical protein
VLALRRLRKKFLTRYGMTKQAAEKVNFAPEKEPQGLKAQSYFQRLTARLKSCPDTNQSRKRVLPQPAKMFPFKTFSRQTFFSSL